MKCHGASESVFRLNERKTAIPGGVCYASWTELRTQCGILSIAFLVSQSQLSEWAWTVHEAWAS